MFVGMGLNIVFGIYQVLVIDRYSVSVSYLYDFIFEHSIILLFWEEGDRQKDFDFPWSK